jgi:hypothetical protein
MYRLSLSVTADAHSTIFDFKNGFSMCYSFVALHIF